MHSMIRHPTFPFLLLLCIAVAAASNAFVPRRHRRYISEASSRPSIDSSQSLHQRDAILPFGLQIRGGDLVDEVITSEVGENDEEAMDEAADSDGTATRVWEEEIKRTRSFYQEQSVNNDDDDDGDNDQDEHSETLPAASDPKAVSTEEVDDSEPPVQADEDIDDVVEVKEDTEDNTEGVEEVNQVGEVVIAQVDAAENESAAEVLEEAQEEVAEEDEEAFQVEVVAEEQSSGSGEVESVDTEEIIASEEEEVNKVVEVSGEAVTEEVAEGEEVAGGEEVVAGEIADEVEGDQATAMEESADSDDIVDTSEPSVVVADDEVVAEEEADAAANDESSVHTPEQDASPVAVTDEPTSLVRKASALVQVMLLRWRIAVSKNKGVQYLAQNKPKIKVIALASLGGVLSLLVGGQVFFAMQEAGTSELPNDELIEEEMVFVDDADEDDNDY